MVIKNLKPLKENLSNVEILNAIRHDASPDYIRRVPEATRANIKETLQRIHDYGPHRNEFLSALINKVGLSIFREISWSNPLAKFKRGMLEWGESVEEVLVGLVQAEAFDPNRDSLERDVFGRRTPEVQAYYHTINRMNKYKITLDEAVMKRAFTNGESFQNMLTQLMGSLQTSDQWDEFLSMANLFNEVHENNGFFKIQIPDISAIGSDEADSKYALRRMRELADTLPFLSRHYNPAHMPVAVDRDKLELIITPEAKAAMDVEALAGAFNEDRARMDARTTVIPSEYINIPGFQAALTTSDFFMVFDSLLETRDLQNPDGLYHNYWLHHHEVVSASLGAPMILFTTEEGDEIVREQIEVTSVEVGTAPNGVYNRFEERVTSVIRGELYSVAYTVEPADSTDNAVIFRLAGDVHPGTYIANTSTLLVSIFEPATSLTIEVVSTSDNAVKDSYTINVVGDRAQIWPNPEVIEDNDNDGLPEVEPVQLTKVGNTVTIPNVTGIQYRKEGANVNNGTVHTITTETDFDAVARTGYELKAGPYTWTFNV